MRPDIGTEARTKGPYSASYRARVLPEGTDITDDPHLQRFAGVGIIGAYDIDEEGVPAQPVNVVENGKLTNISSVAFQYEISRVQWARARGPCAASTPPDRRSQSGVCPGRTPEELNGKLLAMARERGLDTVFMADKVGADLTPRVLYSVNVKDGSRQLVRGAVFDDLDQRSLRPTSLRWGTIVRLKFPQRHFDYDPCAIAAVR